MSPITQLVCDPWFWLTVFVSVVGAFVVYAGLKIGADAEKLLPPSDFKEDIFDEVIRPYKSKIDLGHKIVMAGVAIEAACALAVCIISGLENVGLKQKVADTESNNLELQTNVASLNGAVIRLAHQYDLSTNALEEANARISEASASAESAKQFAGDAKTASQTAQEMAAKLPKSRFLTGLGQQIIIRNFLADKSSASNSLTAGINIESMEDEPKELGGQIAYVLEKMEIKIVGNTINASAAQGSGVKVSFKEIPNPALVSAVKQLFKELRQPPDVVLNTNQAEDLEVEVFPRLIE